MALEDDTSLSLVNTNTSKPQFFKVLFPDPYANPMIPRKFHVNLPHKLPKLATLFSPTKKFWHVEICRIDEDLYIQNGWSEFAKVHDLQSGYLMVFRYEGNMIFKVKIFDTTGCLKDYSLGFGLGSHAKHAVAEARIKNEPSSSDTRNQTSSKSSQGVLKKRKLADEEAAIDKREKGSTSQVTVQVQEKKKPETSFDSTTCSKQFERIIRRYCFSRGFLMVPKEFCVKNGLVTRRTVHLKMSSSESEGRSMSMSMSMSMSWPVHFNLRAVYGTLGKGWNNFREAAQLKEGDRCIFRLVSQNSFSVHVVPRESNLTGEGSKGKAIEGSTSSDIVLDLEEKHYSRPILEYESIVRKYNILQSYQSIANAFCLSNNLTSTRNVTLRDLKGKEWCVKFYMHQSQGRLSRKGWTDFAREYGLEIGDKCIFKLIEKDTLLVRVVKKEDCKIPGEGESNLTGERKGKGKGKAVEGSTSSDIAVDVEEKQPILEWESVVKQYNLKYSYQSLAKAFCLDNNLTSTRNVTLRDLRGKEWCAKFYMCEYKGRLSRKGWTDFAREYGLQVGDKCVFKVIEKDTLLVQVVKK